jgi:CRP/FNR family transcriptional regulator
MSALDPAVSDALSLSLLASFPAPLRERLLADAIRVDVPAGGTIYREDDTPRCTLVVSGLVRNFMTSPTGREVTVRYARPGDLLGIATVVGGPAPVAVQMVTDVTLLFLNAATLAAMGRTEPAVGWLLAEEVTRRLYETLEILADQTFGSLRQRVARHLLDLAASQRRGGQPLAPVTQQALADAVGSVRPAVARVIGELRDAGLVETVPDGIVIRDPARLYDEVFTRHLSHM